MILRNQSPRLRINAGRAIVGKKTSFPIFDENITRLNAVSRDTILTGCDPGILCMVTFHRILPNLLGTQANATIDLGNIRFQFRVQNQRPIITGIIEGPCGTNHVIQLSEIVTLTNNNVSLEVDLVFLFRSLQLIRIKIFIEDDNSIGRKVNHTEIKSIFQPNTLDQNVDTPCDQCNLLRGHGIGRRLARDIIGTAKTTRGNTNAAHSGRVLHGNASPRRCGLIVRRKCQLGLTEFIPRGGHFSLRGPLK